MNGKLDSEIFDGINIEFEANALKMGTDGRSVSTDPLTISVKLTGDGTHLFDLGRDLRDRDIQIKLEGELQVALGGSVVGNYLAKVAAAELEMARLAQQTASTADNVARHSIAVGELEGKLAAAQSRGAARQEIAALERQFLEHNLKLRNGVHEIERLAEHTAKARGRIAASAA